MDKQKITVHCFGDFRVYLAEQRKYMKWRTKKAKELFAYLVHRQNQTVGREELIRNLWPEAYPNNAVALFHNLVYSIRRELAQHGQYNILLHSEGGYSLDKEKMHTDLEQIRIITDLLERCEAEQILNNDAVLEGYRELYMGNIDGIWMYSQREYYEQVILKAYRMLAEAAMGKYMFQRAIIYLQKAMEIDPFSDQTMVLLLHCFGAVGDLKRMKLYYERFRDVLRKEFAIEPGNRVAAASAKEQDCRWRGIERMFEYNRMYDIHMKQTPYHSREDCLQEWRIYITLLFKLLFFVRQETREGRCSIYLNRIPLQEQEVSGFLNRAEYRQDYGQLPIEELRLEFRQAETHLRSRLECNDPQGREGIYAAFVREYDMNFCEMIAFFSAQIIAEDGAYETMVQMLTGRSEEREISKELLLSFYELVYPERGGECRRLLRGNTKAANLFAAGRYLSMKAEVICYIRNQGLYTYPAQEIEIRQWLRPEVPGTVLLRTRQQWDDLLLDEASRRQLKMLECRIRYQELVMKQWGFAAKLSYGCGVSALFYGVPGTGKTMAAGVLAESLGMDLMKVEISAVLSKYIGETEKNLTALFRAASGTDSILFFDEADALFGKRTEVRSSNDRNANAETAHLLQCMEAYQGIVILASNHRNHMDEAFTRRISFLIPFSVPTKKERYQMWTRMLPDQVPCGEELALEYYAEQFELTGSSIREILLNAAYLAAEEGSMKNHHIREAIRMDFRKYGRKYISV